MVEPIEVKTSFDDGLADRFDKLFAGTPTPTKSLDERDPNDAVKRICRWASEIDLEVARGVRLKVNSSKSWDKPLPITLCTSRRLFFHSPSITKLGNLEYKKLLKIERPFYKENAHLGSHLIISQDHAQNIYEICNYIHQHSLQYGDSCETVFKKERLSIRCFGTGARKIMDILDGGHTRGTITWHDSELLGYHLDQAKKHVKKEELISPKERRRRLSQQKYKDMVKRWDEDKRNTNRNIMSWYSEMNPPAEAPVSPEPQETKEPLEDGAFTLAGNSDELFFDVDRNMPVFRKQLYLMSLRATCPSLKTIEALTTHADTIMFDCHSNVVFALQLMRSKDPGDTILDVLHEMNSPNPKTDFKLRSLWIF